MRRGKDIQQALMSKARRPSRLKRTWELMALSRPLSADYELRSGSIAAMAAALFIMVFAGEGLAQALGGADKPSAIATLLKWLPLILFGTLHVHIVDGALAVTGQLGGFALNILVSVVVMAAGTVLGVAMGLVLVSPSKIARRSASLITQFFRNTPWLVLLFFAVLLLPFRIHIFGFSVPFPDWAKASVALTFPIMANVGEITRGAIQSIPTTQWDSAESLALSRLQSFRFVILPQCVKRMTPPWMNWFAILMMESSLISIVGVNEAMTLTNDALAAESRSELLIPMYGMLLALFFAFCYPIARWTRSIEKRFEVLN